MEGDGERDETTKTQRHESRGEPQPNRFGMIPSVPEGGFEG